MNRYTDEQLTLADFNVADKALVQDEYVVVGKLTVPVTERMQLGYGDNALMNEAPGRIYMNLIDTAAAAIKGKVKFQIRDAQDNVKTEKVSEHTLSGISLGATDQTKRTVYPRTDYIADRQRVVTMLVKCTDSGKTLDVSASDALISAIRFAL